MNWEAFVKVLVLYCHSGIAIITLKRSCDFLITFFWCYSLPTELNIWKTIIKLSHSSRTFVFSDSKRNGVSIVCPTQLQVSNIIPVSNILDVYLLSVSAFGSTPLIKNISGMSRVAAALLLVINLRHWRKMHTDSTDFKGGSSSSTIFPSFWLCPTPVWSNNVGLRFILRFYRNLNGAIQMFSSWFFRTERCKDFQWELMLEDVDGWVSHREA